MASSALTTLPATIPAELTLWVTRLRLGVVVGLFVLLMAGRSLAHLPIPLLPIIATACSALLYNAALTAVLRRSREQPAAVADWTRTWVLYLGGLLDAISVALVVLFSGGLVSPWLYFFLATTVVSSAILPPIPGRVITALNAVAALGVVFLPSFAGSSPAAGFLAQPGYAVIVGISLTGLMGLTAYAVSVPAENARAAARFQEGLAHIAWELQRAPDVEHALATACSYAQNWFDVDGTVITLLDGEQLVVKAAEGVGTARLLGRRTPVNDPQSLEVDVLRRRAGFYVNDLPQSPYAGVAEPGDLAILLVPLLGALGVLGVLTMSQRRPGRRFTTTIQQRANILAAQVGAAVENARLLERVREEAESVGALLAASERLTKSQELPTLLTDLNRMAAELAHCDRSTTFLWDANRGVFHFGSTFGNPAPLAEAIKHLEFPRGIHPLIERVLTGETFTISANQAAAQLPADLQATFRLGASAVVPLKTEQLQGVMTVSYVDAAREFSAEQLWLLRGMARHAALAIERARLMEQERQATAAAEAVVTLGRELSATLDRRHLLSRIPEMAATAAGSEFAVLTVWDPTSKTVHILGAYGFPLTLIEQAQHLAIPMAESPFQDVFTQGRFLEISSPQALPQLPPGIMEYWGITSMLSCLVGPVEQRIGSLTVGYRGRTGPFSAAQRRLLDGIAEQANVVFETIRLVEDLQQANQIKSDFLSTVSHELRTPLNAIIGYTDLLRERALGPLHPEQLEVLDIVAAKGVQLLDLINTTLDLTRLEAGQVRLEVSEFALADLLHEVRRELADEVAPLVQFTCSADDGLPSIASDRSKLKTVVKNLAHNALKFTRQGEVEVHAQLATGSPQLQIVVRDTGIGIAAEHLSAIFEMFRQLEAPNTRQFGGVGLGLYIVQRLLELLGGAVQVASEPDRGSTFTVTLPLRVQ